MGRGCSQHLCISNLSGRQCVGGVVFGAQGALAVLVGDSMCGCSELEGTTICHVGEKGKKL